MNEKHERLFRFRDEVDASFFVTRLNDLKIHDRVWVGPFVRVRIGESQRGSVESEAETYGGKAIGKWMEPTPSVEKLLADTEGYREIYGGIPEDEGGACLPGGEEGRGRVGRQEG